MGRPDPEMPAGEGGRILRAARLAFDRLEILDGIDGEDAGQSDADSMRSNSSKEAVAKPSGASFIFCWNRLIPAAVSGPTMPSASPASKPSAARSDCISRIITLESGGSPRGHGRAKGGRPAILSAKWPTATA